MPSPPAFVTQYEILRSQDYVMITLRTPTGDVIDGRMQTQEIQKIALTHPRFLEFAAAIGQIAGNIQGPSSRRVARPFADRRSRPVEDDADRAENEFVRGELGDWVVKH